MKFKICLLAICLLATCSMQAATTKKMPTCTVEGTPYYYYKVKKNQSINDVAKQLNVSSADVVKYNLQHNEALAKDQLVLVPVTAVKNNELNRLHKRTAMVSDTATAPIYHEIASSEDIYTLALDYNTAIEDLLQVNQALLPQQFTAGQTIKILPNTASRRSLTYSYRAFKHYVVKNDETFYSIAKRNGISEDDLVAANPGMKKAKKNKIVNIPYTVSVKSRKGQSLLRSLQLSDVIDMYEPRLQSIYNSIHKANGDSTLTTIAMVLPFQLQKKLADLPQRAILYTEFYKGFLIGLDKAGKESSKKVNLLVYDTQHNLNVTDSILALPALKKANVIIAPSEPAQLKRLNEFGRNNNVQVLNCFTISNDDYKDNPYVLQSYTTSENLAKRVVTWFEKYYSDYTAIFLDESSSGSNKDVVNAIQQSISNHSQSSITLNVQGALDFDAVSRRLNPGGKYVFIPTTGSKSLLRNILPALKRIKADRFDCTTALIGSPEYIMYLKDYQEDLQNIDTYVYTRFFNSKGYRTRDFEYEYNKRYDGGMLNTIPNMAIYGYDTAMYLVGALAEAPISEHTPDFFGIQNNFYFKRVSNWGGLLNNSVQFLHFTPQHTIEPIGR